MKNKQLAGTAIKILFVNMIVFSVSLCSQYENRIAIKDTKGNAIINPANLGFWPANQLAKAIIIPAPITFNKKNNINIPYSI